MNNFEFKNNFENTNEESPEKAENEKKEEKKDDYTKELKDNIAYFREQIKIAEKNNDEKMVLENEDKLREVEQLLNELNNNEWKNDEIEEIKKDIEIIKNEETIKLEHNKLINDNAYFREQIKIAEKNNDEKMVLENEDKLRKTETKLKIINELDSLKLQRKELEKDILDYREQIKIAEKNNDEKMVLENENELREVEYRKKENEQRVEELINNYNDLEKEKEDIEVEKEKEDLEVEKEKEDLEVEKEDNSEKKKKNKKPFWKKWFRKNN